VLAYIESYVVDSGLSSCLKLSTEVTTLRPALGSETGAEGWEVSYRDIRGRSDQGVETIPR